MSIKNELIVSTDSLGIFGDPRNLDIVWGFLKKEPSFGGVELMGFRSHFHSPLEDTVRRIRENGFRISGIHGRIGAYLKNPLEILRQRSFNPIIAAFLNGIVVDTPRLLGDCGSKGIDYVLFHVSEVDVERNFQMITGRGENTPAIFIENDYTSDPQGLNRAVERVKQLRGQGRNARLMFDMYHAAMSPYHQSPLLIWKKAIESLANVRKTGDDLLGGVHIPLGLRMDDSLPFEEIMDDCQIWRDFAGVLNEDGGVLRRVVENQQLGFRNLTKPSLSSLRAQGVRNRTIYDKFEKFGIA